MKTNFFLKTQISFFIIIFLLISGCKTTSNLQNNNNFTESIFYQNYKKNTIYKNLSNGIKVVINNNPNAKINTMSFYFETGASSWYWRYQGFESFGH